MPRRQVTRTLAAPPAAPIIDPRVAFDVPTFCQVFGVPRSCIAREVRLGRLRVARRGGKYFVLGAWALQWIETGELKPRRRAVASPSANGREGAQ
jgi:hypothetical protein